MDLNPHQVEAALFVFRSLFSKGAILADEVGWGKTIEAGLLLVQMCLSIDAVRNLNSVVVLERLAWLMSTRGVPEHIRSDTGAAFTAGVMREWLCKVGVNTQYIEPSSPWENGYVERFNGKLRDELLNGEIFYKLREAKALIEMWRKHYNTLRPHSSLGYRPPAPETIAAGPPSASLRSAQQRGAEVIGLSYPVEQVMKLVLGALVDVDGHGQLPAADHAGVDTWPGCRFLACAASGTPVVINIRMIASGISRLSDRDLAGENLLRLLLGLARGRKEWRAGCLERLIDLPATVHALPASRAYTATISVGGLGPTF